MPSVAEREFQRALQLDPANAQATNLLAQIQKDRQAREREQRLKEGLSQAENLISGKKFDEAQRKLTELQQAYPDAEEVQQKLQALNQRKAEAAAPRPAPAAPSAPAERAPHAGRAVQRRREVDAIGGGTSPQPRDPATAGTCSTRETSVRPRSRPPHRLPKPRLRRPP